MFRLPYSMRSTQPKDSSESKGFYDHFPDAHKIPDLHKFMPLYPKTELHRRRERMDTLKGLVGKISHVFGRGSLNFAASANSWVGPVSMPQPEAPTENYVDKKSKVSVATKTTTFFERKNQRFSDLHPAAPADSSLKAAAKIASAGLFSSESSHKSHRAVSTPSKITKPLLESFFPDVTMRELALFQIALQKISLPEDADRRPILHALAVSSSGNVALAFAILNRIGSGLSMYTGGHTAIGLSDVKDNATWRFAQLLSRTERDFKLLQMLHPEHAHFGRAERIILQVGDEVSLLKKGDATPAAIQLHLAQDTELAESLAARVNAAAYAMLRGEKKLGPNEKGVIFAWEQGFRSDAQGSPLDLAKQRMFKFVTKTIPRVGTSRYKSFIPRLFGFKKSPLSAMQYGVNGANRNTTANERESLTDSMQIALTSVSKNVELDPSAVMRDAEPDRALVAVATLAYWASQSVHYKRRRIGTDGLPHVIREMRRLLDNIPARERKLNPEAFSRLSNMTEAFEDDSKRALKKFPEIEKLLRIPLSIHRLEAWGRVRYLPQDDKFWLAVDTFKVLQHPQKLRLERRDPAGAREVLERLIFNIQSSGRARFVDGARHGFNTKGLTVNLSHLLNLVGIPFGPRLTLGAQRSRGATLDVGPTVFAGEILIGTDRKRRTTLGGGFIAGYDLQAGAAHARCGASIDLTRSHEVRKPSGLMFRFVRRLNSKSDALDDARMKTGMKDLVGFFFDNSKAATAKSTPDQLFNNLAQKFLDHPDISISWNSLEGRSTDYSASAGIGALLRVDTARLRVGPSAVISVESSSTQQRNKGDQGGRMRATSYRSGKAVEVAATIGLNGKISGTTDNHRGVNTNDIGLFNAGLPDWVMPIYQRGQLTRARLIRENGELQAKCCTLDREFNNFTDYRNVILAHEDEWVTQFAKNYPDKLNALSSARIALHEHLAEVERDAQMNHTFVVRDRLRHSVAREINANCAAASAIRLCDHLSSEKRQELCAGFEAASNALVADRSSWRGLELKVVEKSGREHRHGLLLGLQLTTETIAEGERKLSTFTIKSDMTPPVPANYSFAKKFR